MDKQNEANGTASEPIARYDELPILRTYKVAFDNILEIGGFWAVGTDKVFYHIEMPDKIGERMWKGAKRYDIQTGKVMGYTNADRIRSLSDEELAEWIGKVTGGGYGMCAPGHYDCTGKDSCAPCWLDWLKKEVEE